MRRCPTSAGRQANLIYECVGRPGMLQQMVEAAPFDGRIVMGGYCMEEERMFVFAAQNKRLTLQFAGGEEAQDMDLALRAIAEGSIDVTPWLGARYRPVRRGAGDRRHVGTRRAGADGGRSAAAITRPVSTQQPLAGQGRR